MLIQIQDLLDLNFNLLSEAQISRLPDRLGKLRNLARREVEIERQNASINIPGSDSIPALENKSFLFGGPPPLTLAGQVIRHIDGITKQCSQAGYFYLKGALQELSNLEIESDRLTVISFIESLGFDPILTQSLNEVERNFRSDATGFELKGCMGHLRSFIEQLHIESCRPIATTIGEPPPATWGKAVKFLRNNNVLSVQEECFITSLYTLISDEAVHPLVAEREYARIRRNMIIEYGLMFLTVLEKKGIRVGAAST